ncbi:DUF3226 domain-containing protein [Brucellaceae bacterium D45D]
MSKGRILLAEGVDDLRVLGSILKRTKFPEVFTLKSSDGIENVIKEIPIYLKGSGMECLGVVVDADFDLAARWQSLRDVFRNAGYKNITDAPEVGGSVLVEDRLPRVGIWLMPDNNIPGMLEDFVSMLIDNNDELKSHAERVVDGLPECEGRFISAHRAKAIIHTWLAWRENPGTPMGSAITYKYLTTDNDHVRDFSRWLERVFVT